MPKEPPATTFGRCLAEHRSALDCLEGLAPRFEAAAHLLTECIQGGHTVLLCGNGGSAADALHLAGELVGRFLTERRPLPAITLGSELSSLTAIANDYGYEQAFARILRAVGKRGDVLIAISTSGDSPNVLQAAEAAKVLGIAVIGLTGADGGALARLSDVALAVAAPSTPRIQEMHGLLGHALCDAVDQALSAS